MAHRRSTRNATGPSSKKAKTAPKANQPAAAKKAIEKAVKKEPSPQSRESDHGDSDEQENSVIYELKTKNDRMVRKIQCTMDNGNIATLGKKNYTQMVELTSKKPFSLAPVLMHEGPYSGRYVLVLQPEPADNEKFPFLELPAEIRNMIYSFVLERPGCSIYISGKHTGIIDPRWRKESDEWIPKSTQPYSTSLMRVNKQINIESTPYLFSRHKFEFPDTTMMQRFLEYIGPERVKSLVSVKVDTQYSVSAKRAYKLLAAATSLTNLELLEYHWRRYSYTYTHNWHWYMVPMIQAMCLDGRSREDAISIISIKGSVPGSCPTHGQFRVGLIKQCERAQKAYDEFHKKLRTEMGKLLDDAQAKKKAIKKGTPTKTRAGRKTKTVDYADDDSDSDYEG